MKLKIKDIKVIECKDFYSRLKGFMFKKKIIDYGLLFKDCNSIHTFFMLQNIDVIMTDKLDNILFMYESLKPWQLIMPKKRVVNIYELPVGSIKKIKSS